MTSYFRRLGPASFMPTDLTEGAWDIRTQHIAPALGLAAHVVETDAADRRDDPVVLTRLACDILGTIPLEEMTSHVEVLRAGRTIELVEATLVHGGRAAVRARAWLQSTRDTTALAGSRLDGMPPRSELPEWDPTQVWPGGFISSVSGHRRTDGPGRSTAWITTDVPLLDDEPVSATARLAGLVDIANGIAVYADPQQVTFPNLDLTLHLVREPAAGWVGFDTRVTFGPTGLGLTSSVVHDANGPVGTVAQTLTVRPV